MFRDQKRYGNDPLLVRRTKPGTFNKPLLWSNRLEPGEQLRVFTCSWSDFFLKEADEWRPDAWDIIRKTPNLIYQILTKRPGLIAKRLPEDWGEGWDNVWLGISAEDQPWFDRRWAALEPIPAKTKFVSYEPSIGAMSVRAFLAKPGNGHYGVPDWVIVGGESGGGARPFDPAWADTLIQEGDDLGFRTFVKQMGKLPVWRNKDNWPEGTKISAEASGLVLAKLKDRKGGDMSEWPENLRRRDYPV
jgi:protein gp37